MDFENYLVSKKIDGQAFQKAEPELYETWKITFTKMHPASFTMQNLNLINPLRRKYLLRPPAEPSAADPAAGMPSASKPKPVVKPRPKFN